MTIKIHSIDIDENEINIKADGINQVPMTFIDGTGDPQPVYDGNGVQVMKSQENERIVVQFDVTDTTDAKRSTRLAAAMNGRLPDVLKAIRAKAAIQQQTIMKLKARIVQLEAGN